MAELPLILVTEDRTPRRRRGCGSGPASSKPPRGPRVPRRAAGRRRHGGPHLHKVNAALLARCPKLKVVGRGGVGLENIDVAACAAASRSSTRRTQIPSPSAISSSVALQLLRPWAIFRDRAYEPEEFKRVRNTLRGVQLNELTFGILGMGRVGRRVGHMAATGFGSG